MLRHVDYGEADRMLTLYTRQLGKTRALAKGARKIASRKAGHIEPFTYVKLQLAQGRDDGVEQAWRDRAETGHGETGRHYVLHGIPSEVVDDVCVGARLGGRPNASSTVGCRCC